ncbi:MAG: S41 family peptidase [Pseudomonadota bacterium]|nr:S41 family peptidase [Pseudomonadota bacterium]
MSKQLITALGLGVLISACGGGGGGGGASNLGGGGQSYIEGAGASTGGGSTGGTTTDPCGVTAQIDFIDRTAKTYYYWYDELADVNKTDFNDPEQFLAAIMAPVWNDGSERDPGYSYVTTLAADQASISNNAYYGFGFRFQLLDDNTVFYFSDSFEDSPAFIAGLRRGQQLLAIDMGQGFESWESITARGATSDEVFGPSNEAATRTFRVDDNGVERDIEVTKAEINTPPIAGEPLLIPRAGNSPVGYLHFRSFISAAYDATLTYSANYNYPLPEAARVFKEAGVTDIVIDLRYNSGGLLSVAQAFLNLLAGESAEGEPSYVLKVNDNPENNFSDDGDYFEPLPETFSPLRIAFIVTGFSASASELMINGLDPHIDVALVGGPETAGKAVGQSLFPLDEDECEMALRLISFEIQNGLGQGGYWNGLVSTGRFTLYPAVDDVTRAFGDVNEQSLLTALACLNGDATRLSNLSKKLINKRPQIAPFGASWPLNEPIPLNPDGSIRSF